MKEDFIEDEKITKNEDSFKVKIEEEPINSILTESPKNKKEQKRNNYIKSDPYDTNIFSRLFFIPGLYIIKYIREGLSIPSTLGSLKIEKKSKSYSKKLINEWNHTKYKQLLKIILRANRCPLLLILLGAFIQESLTILSVELAKIMISAYSLGDDGKISGYGFLLVQLILIF